MKPHSGYRAIWVALHGLGLGVWLYCLRNGIEPDRWMTGYIGLVAGVELVALGRRFFKDGRTADGTFSWVNWRFIEDGEGAEAFWRLCLVGLWTVWFIAMFGLYFPLPDWVRWPIALGFGVWAWKHFFERMARIRRAD